MAEGLTGGRSSKREGLVLGVELTVDCAIGEERENSASLVTKTVFATTPQVV